MPGGPGRHTPAPGLPARPVSGAALPPGPASQVLNGGGQQQRPGPLPSASAQPSHAASWPSLRQAMAPQGWLRGSVGVDLVEVAVAVVGAAAARPLPHQRVFRLAGLPAEEPRASGGAPQAPAGGVVGQVGSARLIGPLVGLGVQGVIAGAEDLRRGRLAARAAYGGSAARAASARERRDRGRHEKPDRADTGRGLVRASGSPRAGWRTQSRARKEPPAGSSTAATT